MTFLPPFSSSSSLTAASQPETAIAWHTEAAPSVHQQTLPTKGTGCPTKGTEMPSAPSLASHSNGRSRSCCLLLLCKGSSFSFHICKGSLISQFRKSGYHALCHTFLGLILAFKHLTALSDSKDCEKKQKI